VRIINQQAIDSLNPAPKSLEVFTFGSDSIGIRELFGSFSTQNTLLRRKVVRNPMK
jgi:hypothetical protein